MRRSTNVRLFAGLVATAGFLGLGLVDGYRPATADAADAAASDDGPFQKWLDDVRRLPAEVQLKAVSKKLQELNPGYDGYLFANRLDGSVTEIGFNGRDLVDISPLRAFQNLHSLSCGGSFENPSKLANLEPLRGLPLSSLVCSYCEAADLSPLAGMDLVSLQCDETKVQDLAVLAGMPLRHLRISHTEVSDLSPLEGMPLESLAMNHTRVADLSPLRNMKLAYLEIVNTKIRDLSPLNVKDLRALHCNGTDIADWKPLSESRQLIFLRAVGTPITRIDVAALQAGFPNRTIEWDHDPYASAIKVWKADVEKLRRENERLQARLSELRRAGRAN